jgi:hypothetical protein
MDTTINNSDKITDDNNSESKKKVRRNKKQLFVVERKSIIDKLSEIIKLEENKNYKFKLFLFSVLNTVIFFKIQIHFKLNIL